MADLYHEAYGEFGEKIANKYFKKKVNSTSHFDTDENISVTASLMELNAFYSNAGVVPSREVYLNKRISSFLKERYSKDYEILGDAFADSGVMQFSG